VGHPELAEPITSNSGFQPNITLSATETVDDQTVKLESDPAFYAVFRGWSNATGKVGSRC